MIEHDQFSEFSESHLLPFMFYVKFATGQNDTFDQPFLTFWKRKWYFSDIAVSFNFLVIGIYSFDKKYLINALKQSQIRLFQTVSFCPNHAVSFCPSDLLLTVLVTIQKYDTPQ